ncbi:MAG: sigma-54-dependent Fis family transcriptional regulator [Chthonomonadetes bacterium]|nr:sigma-54-dependent Fis family transcriptional regulator [Chthonomonadetes bacterium]
MKKAGKAQIAPLTLLIVEDQQSHRRVLEAHFSKHYQVLTAEHGQRALDIAAQQPIHLLLVDMILPGMNGLDVLRQVRELHPDVVAIVITAHPTIRTAVQAMKDGAFDYITKPIDLEQLEVLLEKASEQYRLKEENRRLREQLRSTYDLHGIVGRSAAMQEVYELIGKVSNSRATVLIRGESGTGKEMVAKAIHYSGNRAKAPFIAVSCAALPETLMESELFGHEKNAFTGATMQKPGRFELAHGGTLFLDEIAEVTPSVQVKLLRVLQERKFERLGGTKTIEVDVRLIAATNKDLEQMVQEGTFREDLYYRLQVIQIYLPPLRERKDDIPLLVEHFLQRYNEENDKHIQAVTPEAMELLMKYHWPGNVRELENAIERAVVLADPDAEYITVDLLPRSVVAAGQNR